MAVAAPTPLPAQAPTPAARPLPYPFAWAALAFSAGVFWAQLSTDVPGWTPPNWALIASIVLVLLGLIALRSSTYLAFCRMFIAIALLGKAEFGLGKTYETALLPTDFENHDVDVTGFVTRASLPMFESVVANPDWHMQSPDIYQQIDVQAESVTCLAEEGCSSWIRPVGIPVGIYQNEKGVEALGSASDAVANEFHYGQVSALAAVFACLRTTGTQEYLMVELICSKTELRPY